MAAFIAEGVGAWSTARGVGSSPQRTIPPLASAEKGATRHCGLGRCKVVEGSCVGKLLRMQRFAVKCTVPAVLTLLELLGGTS